MAAAVKRPPGFGAGEGLSAEEALALFAGAADDPGDGPRQVAIGAVADLCLIDRNWAAARGDLAAVGRLLTASHRSSQFLFENSTAELDFLVDVLTATEHVFGARLTGGGFGGAVMAMTNGAFGETQAQAVVAAYRARFGAAPDVLHTQTGDGATLL
jgi:galactokinase